MAMRKSDKSDTEDLDVIFDEAFWREVAAMVPGVNFLSAEEAWKDLEIMANNSFGITAEEFIDRWEKRDFSDDEMETATMLSWAIPELRFGPNRPATGITISIGAAQAVALIGLPKLYLRAFQGIRIDVERSTLLPAPWVGYVEEYTYRIGTSALGGQGNHLVPFEQTISDNEHRVFPASPHRLDHQQPSRS